MNRPLSSTASLQDGRKVNPSRPAEKRRQRHELLSNSRVVHLASIASHLRKARLHAAYRKSLEEARSNVRLGLSTVVDFRL